MPPGDQQCQAAHAAAGAQPAARHPPPRAAAAGAAGVVGAAAPFIGSWNPSAKARAAGAPVRIDISRLAEGEMLGPIPAWRGRPIFVVKRSEEALSALNEDPARLADPESLDPVPHTALTLVAKSL